MSDDLQQKISTLEFIEQAVILVRDGKGHGPSDAGYDLVASLLGTAVLGCSAVTVFQYPMPETGVGLVTRMVAVIAPVIHNRDEQRQAAKSHLLDRLRNQEIRGERTWKREDLYED